MATVAENLTTALSNVAAKIAEISANPKPNYSIDGQSFSHADYFSSLIDQHAKLQQALAMQTPFEVQSIGIT